MTPQFKTVFRVALKGAIGGITIVSMGFLGVPCLPYESRIRHVLTSYFDWLNTPFYWFIALGEKHGVALENENMLGGLFVMFAYWTIVGIIAAVSIYSLWNFCFSWFSKKHNNGTP
jgi:hypothetical protein